MGFCFASENGELFVWGVVVLYHEQSQHSQNETQLFRPGTTCPWCLKLAFCTSVGRKLQHVESKEIRTERAGIDICVTADLPP